LRRSVIDGDVERGSLMAGQSVGFVTREQSTAEIIEELVSQALAVLAARSEGMRQRQLVSAEILPGSQAPEDV
jgi:NAD(P)H-dependent flavin oxidoreductase YrpB (nitropropane dioxygenase family)